MSKNSILALSVILALATALPGCKKERSGARESTSTPARPSTPVAAQKLTSEMVTAKIDPQVDCLNRTDVPLQENIQTYHQSYSVWEAHPPKKVFDAGFRGFHPADDPNYEKARSCLAKIREIAKQSPVVPRVDQAAAAYAGALEALIPLMIDADRYYGQQNYSDDKLEAGRTLHSKLQPQLDRFDDLVGQFRDAIGEELARQEERSMAEIEKADGRTLPWHELHVMRKTRLATDAILDLHPREVDSKLLADADASIQQAYDAARAYGEAHRAEKTGSRGRPLWFQLEPSVQDYLKSLKALRQAAGQSGRVTSEDTEALGHAYDAMALKYMELRDSVQE